MHWQVYIIFCPMLITYRKVSTANDYKDIVT